MTELIDNRIFSIEIKVCRERERREECMKKPKLVYTLNTW